MNILYLNNDNTPDRSIKISCGKILDYLSGKHNVVQLQCPLINKKASLEYYRKLYNRLKRSSIMAAEISDRNIDINQALSLSLELDKQVILLYFGKEPKIVSKLVSRKNIHENIQMVHYEKGNLINQLEQSLNFSRTNLDIRFTILVPPWQMDFLDKISQKHRIPKSVYIRQLIEDQIKNSPIEA